MEACSGEEPIVRWSLDGETGACFCDETASGVMERATIIGRSANRFGPSGGRGRGSWRLWGNWMGLKRVPISGVILMRCLRGANRNVNSSSVRQVVRWMLVGSGSMCAGCEWRERATLEKLIWDWRCGDDWVCIESCKS